MATQNITQIPAPRVPLMIDQTNVVSREWFMWFNNIYTITGTGTGITAVINGGTGLGTIPTNGQLLIGNGTGYTLNTLFAGAGISVANGSGAISLGNTGVLSNVAGTGISVSSATGNVTVTNTLPDQIVALTGAGTTTVTGTYPNFTITSNDAYVGTVTSVGLSLPAEFTISNSPVTSSGTLTGVWASQTAKYFFAAPNATAGTPSFRAIVASDIPALSYAPPTSGTSILYGNGTGGFSNVTIGTGVSFAAGTLSATGSGGTVTSVSVVSANGFAGTVATATTTPVITLTTTITGLLKGNGTAISAAVANTDYVPLSTVLTKTADYTITNTDTWIINNKTGSALTLTFPAASAWTGRSITVKNMQAQLVNSASSNIVPIGSTTAGTAILLDVVGNWATMVSDGTNWIIMQAAANNCLLLE